MRWTYSLEELPQVSKEIINVLQDARVVALSGDMGAGKTTFIHAVCDALGVTSVVGSPTFSIINEYSTANGPVYHIDCYRLRDEQEAIDAGVEDCLYSGDWCFVEWPEKIPHIFPDTTARLSITAIDEKKRLIELIKL